MILTIKSGLDLQDTLDSGDLWQLSAVAKDLSTDLSQQVTDMIMSATDRQLETFDQRMLDMSAASALMRAAKVTWYVRHAFMKAIAFDRLDRARTELPGKAQGDSGRRGVGRALDALEGFTGGGVGDGRTSYITRHSTLVSLGSAVLRAHRQFMPGVLMVPHVAVKEFDVPSGCHGIAQAGDTAEVLDTAIGLAHPKGLWAALPTARALAD